MSEKGHNIIKGSCFAIGGFFLTALLAIFTKIAYHGSNAIWVSFITYLAGFCPLLLIILKKGLPFLKSNRYFYLIGRATFGTLASFLFTVAIKHIPIVNATLFFNTAPIFIPFLTVFWLKKLVPRGIWVAVFLGFLGIIVIIGPGDSIFSESGNFIALGSGVLLAIAYLFMKLASSTEPASRIIFYYLGIGTLLQLPLLFFAVELPSLESVYYSILCGILLMLSQFMLVKAYTYAEASEIGVLQYSSVVFVGIINWIIWGNTPPVTDILGIILVAIAGGIIIFSSKNNKIERA